MESGELGRGGKGGGLGRGRFGWSGTAWAAIGGLGKGGELRDLLVEFKVWRICLEEPIWAANQLAERFSAPVFCIPALA